MITRDWGDGEGGMGRATFSDCEKYRYALSRVWELSKFGLPRRLLSIVMLNPSTADEKVLDPTIRRCVSFARREGYHGLLVANIFAYRATDPAEMKRQVDPIGEENDATLKNIFMNAKVNRASVLCGWGAHGGFKQRSSQVVALADEADVRLSCLGHTASGEPRHPLYVRGDAQFESLT